jgi:hypothetical protein
MAEKASPATFKDCTFQASSETPRGFPDQPLLTLATHASAVGNLTLLRKSISCVVAECSLSTVDAASVVQRKPGDFVPEKMSVRANDRTVQHADDSFANPEIKTSQRSKRRKTPRH